MKTDLIVVGSGIVGLATAFLAHEKGLSVRVIDRSERPVGSSIMNFGHACFTGQADSTMDMAWVSRQGWIRAAETVGLWAKNSGTYVPAMTEAQMQVLEEFARHRGDEQVQLLESKMVGAKIGNPGLPSVGGAWFPLDMRVNPREAAPKLAAWLAQQGVIFQWLHEVREVASGTVVTNRGVFEAERVICCPNYFLTQLFPQLADKFSVRVCTLTMALIERPKRVPADIALFTGTSLARYDGFTGMPSMLKLKKELKENAPELVDCVANLMATGIPEGIFVGDSHSYALSPDPFMDHDVAQLLIDGVGEYFAIKNPRVIQRWQGRYADSPSVNVILEHPDEQTVVAVVTSGIGMTLSFGVADLALNGRGNVTF
ncbi:TIGR03364 family FAD-dependent oxidoreductase [Corynebacterium sp. sy017]|uniref:TIGR03364 family FAD-dependent oxidoreductase n=1 Tax=unclassified Corynebacterium TaxID=2624378 RepID=UPI0011872E6B|nr:MULTISPECIES: TIGR03364 family FAD-dependent oxidoreductase [unclassified Corynebacterium]MBP3087903.1 TIGR03364 family FAD-dependent oxidoreductase [Corynebacterium sp. sy017]QDZ42871.1 TIGR03364 family FAD-dependent oxidoreductase [Corynebacterium sp. sy039]TSD92444.1 TIGR03364 family FAD-dependent oxidoreductase [Corynebacterium sp. SY003]